MNFNPLLIISTCKTMLRVLRLCLGIVRKHILHASANVPKHGFFRFLLLTVPDGFQNIDVLKGGSLIMMLSGVFSMAYAWTVPQFQKIIGQLMIVRRLPDRLMNCLIECHVFRYA